MMLRHETSRWLAWLEDRMMGRPESVIFFGHGIGDDLLCASLAHELKKRSPGRVVMLSKYPELFARNPAIDAVYPRGYPTIGRRIHWGYRVIVPQYSWSPNDPDRDVYYDEHFLITMCRMAGITGEIDLRTYLTLTPEEKAAGRLHENQIAIQSGGLGTMKNKNWFPERYQAVIDQIGGDFRFVQLGLENDPPLRSAVDLRGKTTLRQSAAILASSRVFIGQVGFLMHLARAVDCRSVIVYGGRETPHVDGYVANENLTGPTPCSPCWQRNRCDFDHACMRMIEPGHVVAAVHRQLAREGAPLDTTRVSVSASPAAISRSPTVAAAETQGSTE